MSLDLFSATRLETARAHPAQPLPGYQRAAAASAALAQPPAGTARRARSSAPHRTLGRPLPASPLRAPLAESTARLTGLDDEIAFAIGWDHAHHGLPLPSPADAHDGALHNGWRAGMATFGERMLPPTAAVQQWLQLRLQAWEQGCSVELMQVTPRLLQKLAVPHCPITREPLQGASAVAGGVDRVRHDAGVAAGNLAVMSHRAIAARRALDASACIAIARQLESDRDRGAAGLAESVASRPASTTIGRPDSTALSAAVPHDCAALSAAQWSRAAVLASFVEPMDHARACELPLLVLPPNRIRLFNPAQALQVLVSQQLLASGWSLRINAIESLIPTPAARRAFRSFFQALLPRVLEAGARDDAVRLRWAIEDGWRHAAVMQRWVRFALLMGSAACERVVMAAASAGLAPEGVRFETLPDTRATDGWCLDTGGFTCNAARQEGSKAAT